MSSIAPCRVLVGPAVRAADLGLATFAQANANIVALTAADRSFRPQPALAEGVEMLSVLFAAPSVQQRHGLEEHGREAEEAGPEQ
jgi:hypothetical protein